MYANKSIKKRSNFIHIAKNTSFLYSILVVALDALIIQNSNKSYKFGFSFVTTKFCLIQKRNVHRKKKKIIMKIQKTIQVFS